MIGSIRNSLILPLALLALGAVAASADPPAETPAGVRTFKLGDSVGGRPIRAHELGDPAAKRKVLVIGSLHGDEHAGVGIVRELARAEPVRGVDLWLIANLNPDGARAHTRQNARGVDLNRNFPRRWRHAGRPFDQHYGGPAPLSEPESRIAHELILRLRPKITLWFHQPLGVVDLSGGDSAIERRFARLTGLPLRRLTRHRGSAASWQNVRLPQTTAFVTELPGGRLGDGEERRYARAVLELITRSR
jgi:protein MpaA